MLNVTNNKSKNEQRARESDLHHTQSRQMSEYSYVQIAPKRFPWRTFFLLHSSLFLCVWKSHAYKHTRIAINKAPARIIMSTRTHTSLQCELARHDTQIAQNRLKQTTSTLQHTSSRPNNQPTNLIHLLRQNEHQMIGDSPPPSPQPPIHSHIFAQTRSELTREREKNQIGE